MLKLIAVAALATAMPAHAITLVTTATDDLAYEGTGGFLATKYKLISATDTVLPQLERSVGEVRIGRANNSERTRALHAPTAGSGLPAPDGTGVVQALTNFNPVASATTAFANGANVGFSLTRVGTTITYKVGNSTFTDTKGFYAGINGLQFRSRGGSAANGATSAMRAFGLTYTQGVGPAVTLADVVATQGTVAIALYDGLVGDFTVAGTYRMDWTGARPNGSALAHQVKLLQLPVLAAAVPEPATWAMMVLGFGAVGTAMRRRGAVRSVLA